MQEAYGLQNHVCSLHNFAGEACSHKGGLWTPLLLPHNEKAKETYGLPHTIFNITTWEVCALLSIHNRGGPLTPKHYMLII